MACPQPAFYIGHGKPLKGLSDYGRYLDICWAQGLGIFFRETVSARTLVALDGSESFGLFPNDSVSKTGGKGMSIRQRVRELQSYCD